MAMRLGDLMVEHGVLSSTQRDEIVAHQQVSGRPFGLLAEEMYGVDPRAVERAWAAQYAGIAETVSLGDLRPSSDAVGVLETRQAWQFGVIPIRFEDGELVLATTECQLARALRFSGWRVPFRCRFVLADEADLSEALERYYPMAGLNTSSMKALRLTLEG